MGDTPPLSTRAEWNGKPLATIVFQNRPLPPFASVLDVAANNRTFEGFDEEAATWFWRFTICVGVIRREKSICVVRHSNILNEKLNEDGETLLPEIARRFPNCDAAAVLRDWVTALRIILEEAQKVEECEWTAAAPCC